MNTLECTLTLDDQRRCAWHNGVAVPLRPRESALLRRMMDDEAVVLSRSALMSDVWQSNHYASANVLEVTISALRRKLAGCDLGYDHIRTAHGVGYEFRNRSDRAMS